MIITTHAKQRLLTRVFGIQDVEDPRSLMLATKILEDNSSHLDYADGLQLIPLVGFKGAFLRIMDGRILTVLQR